ncbi:hypothetical protein [Archangium sp.]|uniref:hypothetical protein n=1 Tax=Archangium sp. TaxID=1872627 RepID=UPI002D25540A|nr:hypothetical protein [Archangium sp.]HYO57409.1 hypothetical protein [Archangium sp.]
MAGLSLREALGRVLRIQGLSVRGAKLEPKGLVVEAWAAHEVTERLLNCPSDTAGSGNSWSILFGSAACWAGTACRARSPQFNTL